MEAIVERNKIIFLTNKKIYNNMQVESLNHNIKYINHDYFPEENQENDIDLAILDVDHIEDSHNLIDRLKHKKAKIGILVSNVEKEETLALLRLNLDAYFHTQMDQTEFNRAIDYVLKGNKYIHSNLTNYILKDYARLAGNIIERPVRLLSNREWEILEQMVKGYSNKMIGENLLISERTVKNHISSIFRKINVEDRTSAVVKAIRNNWVMLD